MSSKINKNRDLVERGMPPPQHQPSVRKGSYRGDVSALCLVSSPRRHLLLAGTGPHVLLYDLMTGVLLCSRYVFDGVRVHGIYSGPACLTGEKDSSTSQFAFRSFTIVIHGERRVKLFKMVWRLEEDTPHLHFLGSLPRFSYWVMDVRLVQEKEATPKWPPAAGIGDVWLLSVGLSNNTIHLWDLLNSAFVYRVECSERCLLYSMRLWGDSLEKLRAAAGTVFNEVLVWKLGSNLSTLRHASACLTELAKIDNPTDHHRGEDTVQNTVNTSPQFGVVVDNVDPLQRIIGHEGSIYRLMWSCDGLSLVSVSDDRSARVWSAKMENIGNKDPWVAGVDAGPVLYGHGSRLWDCYVGEQLLITASEDCTCRVWTAEGKYLATLKGHIGRGIWRCTYDPELNILVTGGADSSIKVQSLDKWVPRASTGQRDEEIDGSFQRQHLQCDLQSLSISPCWSNAAGEVPSGLMDSKSEYVRCLALSNPWSLYVCTNQGVAYHMNLVRSKEASWTLLSNGLEGPIVCMDVLVQGVIGESFGAKDAFQNDDMVVLGNGRGTVCVMQVRRTAEQCHSEWQYTWAAEKERQLLGVFFCKSMGGRYIFTTDPRGSWCLWHLSDRHVGSKKNSSTILNPPHSSNVKVKEDCREDPADLVAYGSGSHARILCIDVCPSSELLVCGDKQGNLIAFSFPKHLLQSRGDCKKGAVALTEAYAPVQLPVVALFKGAHGISAVASVSVLPFKHGQQAEIISTGSDRCICTFLLDQQSRAAMSQTSQRFLCTGIEKVGVLSVVESLEFCKGAVPHKGVNRRIAAGFTGSDFLLWDLTHQCEVMRVTCGGWRRPHSVFVGDLPELQYCFVFVKDQVIQVQRNWVTSLVDGPESSLPHKAVSGSSFLNTAPKITLQSLRGQFHGMEISSVRFLHKVNASIAHQASNPICWMATSSEDGTVIISRYAKDMDDQLDPTLLLGDHVGGSAVRALAAVDQVHLVNTGEPLNSDVALKEGNEILHGNNNGSVGKQELLFSAGAKEVLTCWLLDWLPEVEGEESSLDLGQSLQKPSTSLTQETTLSQLRAPSSQWLSTLIPQKVHLPAAQMVAEEEIALSVADIDKQVTLQAKQENSKEHSMEQATSASRRNVDADGDQRYLALTAFAARSTKTGTLILFVATASSNATLHLYACHVTHRSWVELAVLEYPSVLVLTIEHFVAPFFKCNQGNCDVYMILTGAAHGNIAMWDITNAVLEYCNFCGPDVERGPSRPLTGRGSQGGRLWKKTGKQPSASPKLKHRAGKSVERDKEVQPGRASLPRREIEISNEFSRYPAKEEMGRSTDLKPFPVLEEKRVFTSPRVQPSEQPAVTKPAVVLNPFQQFIAAHQSGINCMSVARLQRVENLASNKMVYMVISGGDDQALHMAIFTLQVGGSDWLLRTSAECVQDAEITQGLKVAVTSAQMPTRLQYLSQSSVLCAHSSAVKGVWTDGFWAFSTGLDQRLRFWKINPNVVVSSELHPNLCEVDDPRHPKPAPLLECLACVIDVPEAASLDVKDCLGGRYQIAVVGRGLQVINFDSNSLSCQQLQP